MFDPCPSRRAVWTLMRLHPRAPPDRRGGVSQPHLSPGCQRAKAAKTSYLKTAKNLEIALPAVPDLVPGIRSKFGSRGVLLAGALVFEEVESATWFDDIDISHDFLPLLPKTSGT